MDVYYTNPAFTRMPNELQNHICSYLPAHPIKVILDEFTKHYDCEIYDEDSLEFYHHIKFTLAERAQENFECGYQYIEGRRCSSCYVNYEELCDTRCRACNDAIDDYHNEH